MLQTNAFWWSSSADNSNNNEAEEVKQPDKLSETKELPMPSNSNNNSSNNASPIDYGVDISFPMHHASVSTINPLGDMQTKYENYIQGCVDYYNNQGNNKGERCLSTERDRLAMCLRQPQVRHSLVVVFEGHTHWLTGIVLTV